LLALATALAITLPYRERWRRFGRSALWLGLPLAAGCVGLLGYNRARFDRWFEFGRTLQLSWMPSEVSKAFIVPNVYSYAFRTLTLSCTFPYVQAPIGLGPAAYPKWMSMPAGSWPGSEQVIGMVASTPWLWLGLLAVALAARSLWRIARGATPWEPRRIVFAWAVTALSVAGSVTLMTALIMMAATMRYLGDVAGAVALLGALGAWSLHTIARSRRTLRWTAAVVCWLLAVPTIAVGLAQGFEGQYTHFRKSNPALMQKLEKRFSICGDRRS
jgi:hypothetical protein